jgi:hypothetical protein
MYGNQSRQSKHEASYDLDQTKRRKGHTLRKTIHVSAPTVSTDYPQPRPLIYVADHNFITYTRYKKNP